MKRSKRMMGLITVVLVMTSFLVIGCGDSPNGPLIAGDDDGQFVRPGNAGGDVKRDGSKGTDTEK